MVRFFTYSQYHGKSQPVGSDFIRVHQLIKHWPEAELYKYGENPEVLIFTKVFASQDYQFPFHFKGIKILDICDPMWFEGYDVVKMAQGMDIVTTSTQNLADFISQFHKNVHFVPDRFDTDILPKPRSHSGKAKTVVWFGYSHNAILMKPAMGLLDELDLDLIIVSNDDVFLHQYSMRDHTKFYKYVKYNEDNFYQDIQKADFAILPEGHRPEDAFKSNNRTIKANLAGLPVAKTPEEVKLYMSGTERQKWLDENYDTIKEAYDCRKSIEQLKGLIDEVKSNR